MIIYDVSMHNFKTPTIRSDDCSIFQSLLLSKLPVIGLIFEKSLGSLVCLNVILIAARCSPIGVRELYYLEERTMQELIFSLS
jgi:hypothetical protein